uniref:Ig-like domain-containing protein n=1 Tax=Xiphophorus couchianus TaxID=32473 RepID=A0A3B5LR82_9TELE
MLYCYEFVLLKVFLFWPRTFLAKAFLTFYNIWKVMTIIFNSITAHNKNIVQVMTGSCLTVPCSFDVADQSALNNQCQAIWRSRSTGNAQQLADRNPQTGDLTKKNCTTTFNNMQPGHTRDYYFRIDCSNFLKYSFYPPYVKIDVTDNFPSPTLTPSTLKIKEGESVSLMCSAPAPCLPHPPTLIWTPKLGDIQETLQENLDKTKFKTSVMNFTASHLHNKQNISCTAFVQHKDFFNAKLKMTLDINSPKNVTVSVSPSGPVVENSNATLTCNSDANPAEQNYTWHGVDGSKEIVIGNEKILNIIVSTSKKRFFCMAENDLGEKPSNISDIDVLCILNWRENNKAKEEGFYVNLELSDVSRLNEKKCENVGEHSVSNEEEIGSLHAEDKTKNIRKESEVVYAQVKFQTKTRV